MYSGKEYFAEQRPEELLKVLGSKISEYNRYLETTGMRAQVEKVSNLYFGKHMGESGAGASQVVSVGNDGELKAIPVNVTRNLVKHVLALTTSQKVVFETRAINSDLESTQAARLGNKVMDAYVTGKRLNHVFRMTAERAVVQAQAFSYLTWDKWSGKPYAVSYATNPDGEPVLKDGLPVETLIYEGDLKACTRSRFDVIYDPELRDWAEAKWIIVRNYENKWDLMAKFPHIADEICALPSTDPFDEWDRKNMTRWRMDSAETSSDIITTYEFWHLKDRALPSGRYVKFFNDRLWAEDMEMEFDRLPVIPMRPSELFDSAEGYSEIFDIAALQQVFNVLVSIPFTNQQAFAIQAIHLPDGCQVAPSSYKGLAFLKGGPPGSEPKAVQLSATPAEVFKNIEMIEAQMEKTMGLNSVVRGDPNANLKSGAALGRVQAMAIQFASNLQHAWAMHLEDCGTFMLEILKLKAKTERIVEVAGKANKSAAISFSADKLAPLKRVVVDLGNPLSRTIAGRLELADTLFQQGTISPQEYIQVATTGQLDATLEAKESEENLIQKENESLMEGQAVMVLVGDAHLLHAKNHKAVINDPMIRQKSAEGDPQALAIVKATLAHIQEHEEKWAGQTPFFFQLSGEPPPMPPMGNEGAMPPPPPGGAVPTPPLPGDMAPTPEPPPIPAVEQGGGPLPQLN